MSLVEVRLHLSPTEFSFPGHLIGRIQRRPGKPEHSGHFFLAVDLRGLPTRRERRGEDGYPEREYSGELRRDETGGYGEVCFGQADLFLSFAQGSVPERPISWVNPAAGERDLTRSRVLRTFRPFNEKYLLRSVGISQHQEHRRIGGGERGVVKVPAIQQRNAGRKRRTVTPAQDCQS